MQHKVSVSITAVIQKKADVELVTSAIYPMISIFLFAQAKALALIIQAWFLLGLLFFSEDRSSEGKNTFCSADGHGQIRSLRLLLWNIVLVSYVTIYAGRVNSRLKISR